MSTMGTGDQKSKRILPRVGAITIAPGQNSRTQMLESFSYREFSTEMYNNFMYNYQGKVLQFVQ